MQRSQRVNKQVKGRSPSKVPHHVATTTALGTRATLATTFMKKLPALQEHKSSTGDEKVKSGLMNACPETSCEGAQPAISRTAAARMGKFKKMPGMGTPHGSMLQTRWRAIPFRHTSIPGDPEPVPPSPAAPGKSG